MRNFIAVILFLAASVSTICKAQTNNSLTVQELPPFISAGLNAYKSKGPDEAVRTWIAKSPLEGNTAALTQANNLRQIQDFYGTYEGYEPVSSRTITTTTKVFYLVLKYEKGPLFAKFVSYETSKGWILTSFDFNTKEELILPH